MPPPPPNAQPKCVKDPRLIPFRTSAVPISCEPHINECQPGTNSAHTSRPDRLRSTQDQRPTAHHVDRGSQSAAANTFQATVQFSCVVSARVGRAHPSSRHSRGSVNRRAGHVPLTRSERLPVQSELASGELACYYGCMDSKRALYPPAERWHFSYTSAHIPAQSVPVLPFAVHICQTTQLRKVT